MKLLALRATKNSATHTKDGDFFRIVNTETTTVFTETLPTEAESVEAFSNELGLTPYTPVPREVQPRPVPLVIANWRAKAVLSIAGILPAVETALDALTEPARTVALAAWNGSAQVHRNGPTVTAAIAALGLTDKAVDDLFIAAAALKV
jgi:hypothetical protein